MEKFRFMEHAEMGCPVEECGWPTGHVREVRVKDPYSSLSEYGIVLQCSEGHAWALGVTIHDGVMHFGVVPALD